MIDRRMDLTEEFRLETLANGWVVGRFGALEAMGVAHLVTTRRGPDVQQVRHDPAAAGREIARVLGFDEAAFLEQVHGGEVLACERGGCAGYADGLVTAAKGLLLMGKSGDCPVILIADRHKRAVGFAHASWRATVAGITPAVVRRMAELGCDPRDLVACICPSAGPECYEVGDEVLTTAVQGIGPHAQEFLHPVGWQRQAQPVDGSHPDPGTHPGKYLFDLWHANTDALIRAGLEPESIHAAEVCTLCRNDLFPSHRREGNTCGRFAAVIGWPAALDWAALS